MTRIETIQDAIVSLPENEYRRFRHWFLELDWAHWDERIQSDSDRGRLDFLLAEAADRFK